MLAMGPTQPAVPWEPGDFRGVMRPGQGVHHPLHVASRLKRQLDSASTLHPGLRGLL
jgi:hypothetical protein